MSSGLWTSFKARGRATRPAPMANYAEVSAGKTWDNRAKSGPTSRRRRGAPAADKSGVAPRFSGLQVSPGRRLIARYFSGRLAATAAARAHRPAKFPGINDLLIAPRPEWLISAHRRPFARPYFTGPAREKLRSRE